MNFCFCVSLNYGQLNSGKLLVDSKVFLCHFLSEETFFFAVKTT